jgi:hypothetical protein
VAALPLTSGAASFDPSQYLALGSHTLTASFAGTTNFGPSTSSAVTINVTSTPRRRVVR